MLHDEWESMGLSLLAFESSWMTRLDLLSPHYQWTRGGGRGTVKWLLPAFGGQSCLILYGWSIITIPHYVRSGTAGEIFRRRVPRDSHPSWKFSHLPNKAWPSLELTRSFVLVLDKKRQLYASWWHVLLSLYNGRELRRAVKCANRVRLTLTHLRRRRSKRRRFANHSCKFHRYLPLGPPPVLTCALRNSPFITLVRSSYSVTLPTSIPEQFYGAAPPPSPRIRCLLPNICRSQTMATSLLSQNPCKRMKWKDIPFTQTAFKDHTDVRH